MVEVCNNVGRKLKYHNDQCIVILTWPITQYVKSYPLLCLSTSILIAGFAVLTLLHLETSA